MIILATRALADAMIGCWAVLFDAALGPRGPKDDDAAVPLDVALERALATIRLLRGDAEMQCSSRKSALRTVVYLVTELATTGRHMAGRGRGEDASRGRTRRPTLHERFHGGSHGL